MKTSADLIVAAGLAPPFAKGPTLPVPPGTVCALSGVPLTIGYPRESILAERTAEIAETFPFPSAWVSETVARTFKARIAGSFLILDGDQTRALSPVISVETASKTGRPTWRDVIRTLPIGAETLALYSHESQRRLWPRSTVGRVGPAWPITINDQAGCRCLTVSHAEVLECLTLVETVYAAGFGKALIRSGLLSYRAQAPIRAVGIEQATAWDQALEFWRPRPAFTLARLFAQKGSPS